MLLWPHRNLSIRKTIKKQKLGSSQCSDFTFLCFEPQSWLCFFTSTPSSYENSFSPLLAARSEDWRTWAWQEQRNLKEKNPTQNLAKWLSPAAFNWQYKTNSRQSHFDMFPLLCPVSLCRWLCLRLLPWVCDIDSPLSPSLRQAPDSPVERTKVDTVHCSGPAAPWTLTVTTSAIPLGTKWQHLRPYLFIFPQPLGDALSLAWHVASIRHIPPSWTLSRCDRTAGKVAGWRPALVWWCGPCGTMGPSEHL